MFDFSNYSKDSKFFDEGNKNIIGKMKDEFGGVLLYVFVGLNSEMDFFKKMMIVNVIQQNEDILQQNILDLKMFCLIKKLLDAK